jgi:diacylglycerol kinase (ATP)
MSSFLKKRVRSIGYAAKGAYLLLRTEASVKIQLFIAIGVTAAGIYFNISAVEWMLQLIVIALVMTAEGLNTAIEKTADFIHPNYHSKIGFIKDIAAGAVFIAAIFAIAVACIIYLPKLF